MILVKVKANKIIFLEKHNILNKSQFGFRNINPQNMLLPQLLKV
jgi:hypothetical protein